MLKVTEGLSCVCADRDRLNWIIALFHICDCGECVLLTG